MLDDKNVDIRILELLKSTSKDDANQAFILLYKKYFQMVYSLVRLNNGYKREAEDVFQETLVILYESIKCNRFREDSRLGTYIYSIARNLWFREFSKNTKEIKFEDLSGMQRIDTEIWKENENKVKLLEILFNKIGKKCKELLTYFYFDRLSLKEITEKFGQSSIASLKSQKYRCIQQMIEIIESEEELQNLKKECYE